MSPSAIFNEMFQAICDRISQTVRHGVTVAIDH